MSGNVVRRCGGVAAAGIAVAGAFHLVWAVSPWPTANWTDYAHTVLGSNRGELPAGFPWMCLVVAALLFAAAYLVGARAGVLPRVGPVWWYRLGVPVVAAVFLLRATVAGGFVTCALRGDRMPDPYLHGNLALYSPLCLVFGVVAGLVAWSARGRTAAAGTAR